MEYWCHRVVSDRIEWTLTAVLAMNGRPIGGGNQFLSGTTVLVVIVWTMDGMCR